MSYMTSTNITKESHLSKQKENYNSWLINYSNRIKINYITNVPSFPQLPSRNDMDVAGYPTYARNDFLNTAAKGLFPRHAFPIPLGADANEVARIVQAETDYNIQLTNYFLLSLTPEATKYLRDDIAIFKSELASASISDTLHLKAIQDTLSEESLSFIEHHAGYNAFHTASLQPNAINKASLYLQLIQDTHSEGTTASKLLRLRAFITITCNPANHVAFQDTIEACATNLVNDFGDPGIPGYVNANKLSTAIALGVYKLHPELDFIVHDLLKTIDANPAHSLKDTTTTVNTFINNNLHKFTTTLPAVGFVSTTPSPAPPGKPTGIFIPRHSASTPAPRVTLPEAQWCSTCRSNGYTFQMKYHSKIDCPNLLGGRNFNQVSYNYVTANKAKHAATTQQTAIANAASVVPTITSPPPALKSLADLQLQMFNLAKEHKDQQDFADFQAGFSNESS